MGNGMNEEEIDLLELFHVILKHIWVVLFAGIFVAIISFLGTKFLIVPTYSSTSKLYILSQSTSITSFADIQVGSSLTKDYVQLVQTHPVVDQVIKNLKLDMSYEDLLRKMSFSNPSDTRILVLTCEDPDPVEAKRIVDEFTEVTRTRLSEIMKSEAPTVAEYGTVAKKPVSPNLTKNALIGAMLGILLAMAVFIIRHLLDDSVKTAEDIEKYLGINTLTAIPVFEEDTKKTKIKVKRNTNYRKKGA